MSAFPPPTNGFYNGATYNSAYFVDSDSTGVTKEYLEENYLPRVGNPTDVAESTYFQGEIIEDSDIILAGTQNTQCIQYPNKSKQFTAMNTLPANQTITYATIQTDGNGAISAISNGTGWFYTNIILAATQGQYIQWPNGTKQQTAMNGLVANQTYPYATITTDAYGVIKTLAAGTGAFATNITLTGTQGTQYIQYPNASQQFTAMNTLPANQTYNYATITTDANGAINAISSNSIPSSVSIKLASAYGSTANNFINYGVNVSGGINGPWA